MLPLVILVYLGFLVAFAAFTFVVVNTWKVGGSCEPGSAERIRFRVFFWLFLGIWAAAVYGAVWLVRATWGLMNVPAFP